MDDPAQESGTPDSGAREAAAQEALHRLEARLERASNAAERLMTEAAETVAGRTGDRAGGRRPPPEAGWQVPADGAQDAGRERDGDLELLAEVVHRLRELIPPELQRRLAEALRELLLAVRALIDWYLDRLERRRGSPPEVTDIPIL